MTKIYKISFVLLFVFSTFSLFAQKNFFSDVSETYLKANKELQTTKPVKFRGLSLNKEALKSFLWSLPSEKNVNNRKNAPILEIPLPDGRVGRFNVWESSIQEPGLEAKFPEIKTFAGQGIDDPYATIRFDYNPYSGFHAQILSAVTGRVYIDPYAKGNIESYISYFHSDNVRTRNFNCLTNDLPVELARPQNTLAGPCRGTTLRTYRLAVACTGEYAVAVGGGLAGPTHAAIVTSVNRITGVYEVELAIRMILISNNNLIEYLDGNTDPYVNTINTALLNANQLNIDNVIGFSNYDIGHIFTSDDNGLAQLSSVCGSGKARGATGAPSLVGDGFDIDFVAHEIGHQFGAQHTFNSNSCASPGASFEPGGGTTIMAYAGICAASENIQPNSDAIFHAKSFDDISTFLASGNGGSCGVNTATSNTLPIIAPLTNNNISIPINTPFTLTASATDANGDALTYNWEGWDIGPAGSWPSAATSTTRPLFRTRVSKTTGSRTFPDIRVIAANYPGTSAPSAMDGLRGEVLPQVPRAMKFRLTVRDNRAGGGGVVSAGDGCQDAGIFTVNAAGTAPFTVAAPNGIWERRANGK